MFQTVRNYFYMLYYTVSWRRMRVATRKKNTVEHFEKYGLYAVPGYMCLYLDSLLFLVMGFSWQRYWSGLLLPAPGGLRLVGTLHYDLSILGGPTA